MTALAYPQDLKPLTSLRFLAAFWVLSYHFKDHLGLDLGRWGLVADGYLGVDLFFTLSGQGSGDRTTDLSLEPLNP